MPLCFSPPAHCQLRVPARLSIASRIVWSAIFIVVHFPIIFHFDSHVPSFMHRSTMSLSSFAIAEFGNKRTNVTPPAEVAKS